MHGMISYTSKHPPHVILRRSFTRLSTVLAVIEGLGTRLEFLVCKTILLIRVQSGHETRSSIV